MSSPLIKFDTAYLCLAIPLTNHLKKVQVTVCRDYNLISRPEIHLTIAFFGKADSNQLSCLTTLLRRLIPKEYDEKLPVVGLGGAYEVNKEARLIHGGEKRLDAYPRVLWLAVEFPTKLRAFRKEVKQAAADQGIDTTFITDSFWPHITLGSNGPACEEESYELWDIHTVEKIASISSELTNLTLKPNKLHLSDMSIHPESIHVIEEYEK